MFLFSIDVMMKIESENGGPIEVVCQSVQKLRTDRLSDRLPQIRVWVRKKINIALLDFLFFLYIDGSGLSVSLSVRSYFIGQTDRLNREQLANRLKI